MQESKDYYGPTTPDVDIAPHEACNAKVRRDTPTGPQYKKEHETRIRARYERNRQRDGNKYVDFI